LSFLHNLFANDLSIVFGSNNLCTRYIIPVCGEEISDVWRLKKRVEVCLCVFWKLNFLFRNAKIEQELLVRNEVFHFTFCCCRQPTLNPNYEAVENFLFTDIVSRCRATCAGPLKRVLVSQRSESFYNSESISNDLWSNGDEEYLPLWGRRAQNAGHVLSEAQQCCH
jgi:hypothetical protein